MDLKIHFSADQHIHNTFEGMDENGREIQVFKSFSSPQY